MKKENNRTIEYIAILLCSVVFYVLWCFYDGVFITPDAETYITMDESREAGYCLYLAFFRQIFGNSRYLMAAIIGQSLMAAFAATALYWECRKRFALPLVVALSILFLQYGMTLLNRFVAQRRSGYFNSIETEGLAYSLWVLLFICIMRILYDKRKEDIIKSMLLCIILVLIRKQMVIGFGLLFFAYLFAFCHKKNWLKVCLQAVGIIISSFAIIVLSESLYNFALRGTFGMHSGDSSFILGTEIFVANEEMESYIQEEQNKIYFRDIMEMADNNQYNMQYAEKGWMGLESQYSDSYDRIKFDVINPIIHDSLRKQGVLEENLTDAYNQAVSTLMKEILIPCIPGIFKLYWCNVMSGFITTVLKVHRLLNPIAFLLYVAYILVMAILWKKKSYQKIQPTILPTAGFVLLAIVGNVLFTSTTIYCQMRYMQYSTALFYQIGLIMLFEGYQLWKHQK